LNFPTIENSSLSEERQGLQPKAALSDVNRFDHRCSKFLTVIRTLPLVPILTIVATVPQRQPLPSPEPLPIPQVGFANLRLLGTIFLMAE